MAQLRLHSDLYAASAIDEAVEAFREHARIERQSTPPYEELTVTATDSGVDDEVARELANYILAATIEKHRE